MSKLPIDVVESGLLELKQMVERFASTSDLNRFASDFSRWKEELAHELSTEVSVQEGRKFRQLRSQPSWVANDDFYSVADEHRAYLESLATAVRRRPEAFGPAVVKEQAARKAKEKETPTLRNQQAAVPHEKNSRTLRERVEDHLGIFFLTTLAAGFAAGYGAYAEIQQAAGWERIARTELDSLRRAATQMSGQERLEQGSPAIPAAGSDVQLADPPSQGGGSDGSYNFRASWSGYADSLAYYYQQSPPQCDSVSVRMRSRARARLDEIEFEATAVDDSAQLARVNRERRRAPTLVATCR